MDTNKVERKGREREVKVSERERERERERDGRRIKGEKEA